MLTVKQVENAKAAEKPYKLSDGAGLHLFVAPTGFRSWRYRFQHNGREQLVVIGPAELVTLKQARARRDEIRLGRLGEKFNPPAVPSEPVDRVALRWLERNAERWGAKHVTVLRDRFEKDVFPAIGKMNIRDVTPRQVLLLLRAIEDRGATDIAHRIRGQLGAVFAFAISEELADTNPAEAIKAAMKPIPAFNRRPAVGTIFEAKQVLRKAESMPAHPVIRLAMRFLALTAQRPGECCGAEWREFLGVNDQWAAPVWNIPAERMKMSRPHSVPLARQTVEVLEAVRTYSGRMDHVFPSLRADRDGLSRNALRYLLARAGMVNVQVPHGWRATFSTIMNGEHPQDRLVIDLMLAHSPMGAVEAVYNRQPHEDRRRELAQAWADMLLEGAPSAAELLDLPRKKEAIAVAAPVVETTDIEQW